MSLNQLLRVLGRLRLKLIWVAAAVMGGLLLHIATVLAAAHFWPNPALAAIAAVTRVNEMTVLPPMAAGRQPLAFLSPAQRYAICRFDIRKGPVIVHAALGSDDWKIAILGPAGANVFTVTGADLERRDIDLLLSATGATAGPALPAAKDTGTITAVGLTERTGLALVIAPAGRVAEAETTGRLLAQATCTQRLRAAAPSP